VSRSSTPNDSPAWPRRVAAVAGAWAVGGGIVTLIGWAAQIQRLTDWKNDGISMFPNSAVCAVASGLALLLSVRRPRERTLMPWLAGLPCLVGGLTLAEHLTGINFGIDTLLFDRRWGQGAAVAPMRIGPPASISFVLIGAALLLARREGRAQGVSAASGVAVVAIAMLSLTGHLYGAEQMYTIPRLTGIAFQTASMLFALGIGVVVSATDSEPMRTVLEPRAAGLLVRRALPILVVSALAIGWLRLFVQREGLVDTAFGTALRTLVEIALFTGLLWWTAARIRVQDEALRRSEAEVHRQAGQLGAFLETAAIGLHRAGPDGVILWVNDAELEILGYAREEYVGHHIAEFHADQAAIADILARLHRGEKVFEYPAEMKCKDGSRKSVLIDSSVLWDQGRFVHTQCFTRDVTAHKGAQETRALLAAIVEATDDAVVSKTLEGTITSWNAGAERLFGYSAREAVGRPIDLVIPPDRLDEERDILRRLRRGERIDHFETVRRAKDGRLLEVSLTISPLRNASGQVVGASKIARDITDRKRLEAEREENSRRKDEFIAILAHELRNPLSPVRNAARLLKLKGATDPDLRRPVEIVERQVAQMSRLIDDLLDVSRISRGTLELRRERVSCREVVDAVLDACRDEIQAKGHDLRVSMPAEPIELEADQERLVQLLCNLLGNAAKYTPMGGRLELTVAVVSRSTLEVTVKDNGIGIPPGKHTEIFDLFARVDHSLERQGGLGIGLTLARQLAELHGGTIEALSEGVGHGSEFILRLPVVAPPFSAAAPPAEPRPPCPSLRIVVADDNPDTVESLTLLLELAGHNVHKAFDGEAALSAVEHVLPQVALIDIGMPKANGYQVARRIREQAWGRGVYLVAVTGWGQQADKHRALEAGFDEHLVKPVPPDTLNQLLATIGVSLNGEGSPASRRGPRPT
jgi:PAS domain S-box-containing protein